MRRKFGQEAIEFILITALVFLGALFAVLLFGEKISAFFSSGSTAVQVSNNSPAGFDASSSQKYKPDFETVAEEKPLEQFANSQAVPSDLEMPFSPDKKIALAISNFNDYVQITGSSGGTDIIKAYMMKIAQDMEAKGLTSEADDVRTLANVMHNVASVESLLETKAKHCSSAAEGFEECMNNLRFEVCPEPEGFNQNYSNHDNNNSFETTLQNLKLAQKLNDYNTYCTSNSDTVACSFAKSYGDILEDNNIEQQTKNVVKELSYAVSTMAEQMVTMVHMSSGAYNEDESLLGEQGVNSDMQTTYDADTAPFTYEDFKNYNAGTITNLDAALTCAAGSGEDTGNSCH